MPMNTYMKTFCHVLGDVLHRGPSNLIERLSPWIIGVLGIGILGIMTYALIEAWMK